MTYAQEGYRFRKDDQGELGASWVDQQDAPQIMSMRSFSNEPSSQGIWTPRRDENVNVGSRSVFIAAHIRPIAYRTETIISRFDPTPNRVLHFMLRSDGAILFGYSTTGTDVVDIPSTVQWFSALHSYPIRLGQSFWVGVLHFPLYDILRQTRFYVSPTREALLDHQAGAAVDWGSSGVIYDSPTAPWYLGLRIDGGFHNTCDIYSVEVFQSPTPGESTTDPWGWTPLLNPNFADFTQGWRPGMTGTVQPYGGWDGLGNKWTISWDRVIADGYRKGVRLRLRMLSNAIGASSSYGAAVAALAPVGHWRFSGVGTADSAGAHTLTFGGGATPGVAGVWAGDEAVYFDGVDDYATIANEVDLELTSDMSIEMWVRPHDAAGSGQCILSCRASGDPLYEITYSPDSDLFSFYPYLTAGGGFSIGGVGSSLHNQWHHVVVTLDWTGTTRNLRAYLNGNFVVNLTSSYLPAPVSPAISIGRRSIANDLPFDGDISELAIYPRVLTPEQIAENYRGGLTLMYKRVDEPDTEWREV